MNLQVNLLAEMLQGQRSLIHYTHPLLVEVLKDPLEGHLKDPLEDHLKDPLEEVYEDPEDVPLKDQYVEGLVVVPQERM